MPWLPPDSATASHCCFSPKVSLPFSRILPLNVRYLYRKGEVSFCLPEHVTRILVLITYWYNPGMRKGPEPGFHCIVWFRRQKRFPCIIWHSQRSLVGAVAKLGCHQLRLFLCPKGENPVLHGHSALTSASNIFHLSSEDNDRFFMVTRNGVCSSEHELWRNNPSIFATLLFPFLSRLLGISRAACGGGKLTENIPCVVQWGREQIES